MTYITIELKPGKNRLFVEILDWSSDPKRRVKSVFQKYCTYIPKEETKRKEKKKTNKHVKIYKNSWGIYILRQPQMHIAVH